MKSSAARSSDTFETPRLARTRTWTDDMPAEGEDDLDFDDVPTGQAWTLAELAAPAARVTETTPLAQLRARLVESRLPALCVVDDDHTLVGVIARTDVLRAERPDAVARDVMSPFVFALPASAGVDRAAALMAYEGVSFLIVIGDDHALYGVVSALDVARHYASLSGYLVE